MDGRNIKGHVGMTSSQEFGKTKESGYEELEGAVRYKFYTGCPNFEIKRQKITNTKK